MMSSSELLRPAEVEFGHFTAALITQTLDAVIAAQLEQEARVRELQEMAGLDPERFAEAAVSRDDAEAELARLFPATDRPHGVMPGSPYSAAAAGREEEPPVKQATGYAMKAGDWQEAEGGAAITEAGHDHILEHVRADLAARQLANLLGLVRRGIPRVVVDHGRINAKLTFQVSQAATPGSAAEPAATEGLKAEGIARLAPSAMPRALLVRRPIPLKLTVKPADLRRPEMLRLSVNVVGEVEITFKTVSD